MEAKTYSAYLLKQGRPPGGPGVKREDPSRSQSLDLVFQFVLVAGCGGIPDD